MAVTLVRLDPHNVDVLARVADDVFDEPIDPARVAALVQVPNHILLLAVAEGMVVGQVLGMVHRHPDKPTELYVDDLGVAPAFQRQQIATRPVTELIAVGRGHGADEVWVATEPENEVARAFYTSLGLRWREAIVFEGDIES